MYQNKVNSNLTFTHKNGVLLHCTVSSTDAKGWEHIRFDLSPELKVFISLSVVEVELSAIIIIIVCFWSADAQLNLVFCFS